MRRYILIKPLATIVLAAAMVLVMGLACATYAASGTDGNIKWDFNESTNVLTVGVVDKSEAAMNRCINYKVSAAPWDSYRYSIKKLVTEDGVYGIEGQSFNGYWALEELELAGSVKEITGDAFVADLNLRLVTHPTGDCEIHGMEDPITENWMYPFTDCNLEQLVFDIPDDSFMGECCRYQGLKIKGERGSLWGANIEVKWIGDPLLPEDPVDGYWYFAKKKWTGKAIKAVPVVKLYDKKLIYGEDFTCSFSKNTNVGQAKVTIKGIGDYRDSTIEYFIIYPKGTSISKVTAGKKQLTVKWLKQDKKMSKNRVDGYQVQVATNKGFTKNVKTKYVKGYNATSQTIKSLKSGKTYYVHVRTVMKSGLSVPLSSTWSPVKTVKVK